MISLEEFQVLAGEIADAIPDMFYEGLNGGILLKEEVRLHPLSTEKSPAYILGLYIKDEMLGCRIELYYGSFAHVCGRCSKEGLLEEIRDTLYHEFRHHVETMGGNMDLILEDESQLNTLRNRNKKRA